VDDIDRELLSLLQENGETGHAALAKAVSLSITGVHKRLRRLRDQGYVKEVTYILDREKLGFDLLCFVFIRLTSNSPESYLEIKARADATREVLECYEITGDDDVLLKVAAKNRHHLKQLLRTFGVGLPQIARIKTSIVLEEIKATTALPLNSSHTEGQPDDPVTHT
jgi:Lrp/AsnC family leucine-responsive transcriptional regulator